MLYVRLGVSNKWQVKKITFQYKMVWLYMLQVSPARIHVDYVQNINTAERERVLGASTKKRVLKGILRTVLFIWLSGKEHFPCKRYCKNGEKKNKKDYEINA